VVLLQNGSTLTCNYSETDAPRGLFRPGSRKQEQKDLNNATRAAFKQAVIDIFGTSINDVPKRVRDADGFAKFEGTIRLSAADLDKLANADWKQYDGTDVTATDNDDNLPDHFRKAADKIPEPYKFTGGVDVSFKLHADELQNVG
jgi:hypothetical protein